MLETNQPTNWEYMLMPYKKYADFSGRSTRKEYWLFYLFNALALGVLVAMSFVLGDLFANQNTAVHSLPGQEFGPIQILLILLGLFAFVIIVPSLAVTVRRLHDANLSGWLVGLTLIPYLGWIANLVFGLLGSYPDTNKWGPHPAGLHSEMKIEDHLIVDD